MRIVGFSLMVSAVLIALAACSPSMGPAASTAGEGVRISQTGMTVGGDGVPAVQVLSYSITLANDGPDEVYIKTLQPVLSDELGRRSLTPNTAIRVEKTIAPRATLEVGGKITFDTRNTTKEQIVSWEPMVVGAKVTYERTLQLPQQSGS